MLPSWSLALLAAALTLPALVAAVDAVARARRRAARRSGEWIALGARRRDARSAIVAVGAVAFELVDWLPGSIEEAVAPATATVVRRGGAAARWRSRLLLALAWVTVRRLFAGRRRTCAIPARGAAAIALMLAVEVLVVCALNPYAALLLVPAAHLSLLAALPRAAAAVPARAARSSRRRSRFPCWHCSTTARASISGLSLDSYALMLVSAFSGSLASAVLGSLVAGTPRVRRAAWRLARAPPRPPSGVTVRGPVTYAGPGIAGRHGVGAAPLTPATPAGRQSYAVAVRGRDVDK